MSQRTYKWETDRDSFEVLSKKDFDDLFHNKKFSEGPMCRFPSKFANEFGPYNPHRWAFGQLTDGRFVCCDTAAKEKEDND